LKIPTITAYGGVGEIGGNKILLKDKNTKIFLDFGMSFSKQEKYYAGYLCPRSVNGAGDYLEFGLLPNLKGLYSKESIANTQIRYEKPKIDGIIVSHAHMDHIGYLTFVDEKIPVHCGVGTKIIIEALEKSSKICIGEHIYKTFRTGDTIQVGSLEIEPVHVDHSIPAAYGFIIHTSQGALAYSGDMRIHGPLSQMTWEFAEKAEKADVKLMICEGTRVSPQRRTKVYTETEVKAESNKVVADANKIVIVSFYSRDVDRFLTFYEVAKENNRKLAIPLKLAHWLHTLKADDRLNIPNVIKDDSIIFYKRRKRSGEFQPRDYYHWERPFLDKAKTFSYIRKNQSKIVLNLDLNQFAELIDIKPVRGGDFIHSMSEPFSEEDIDSRVLHNWLDHFGFFFHQIHASGHCAPDDLVKVVDKIHPGKIVPIHSEHPELFKGLFKKRSVELIREGVKLKF
jgi:ribonuclease J